MGGSVRRVLVAVAGGLLTVLGVVLLVLPGPGLLLVLAGLLVLASEFPAVRRYVAPVRVRAMRTAEESVASPWRIATTATGGALLIAAGIVWATQDWIPLSSWSSGSSLILSGLIVFALLFWSYRRVRAGVPLTSRSHSRVRDWEKGNGGRNRRPRRARRR